MKRTPLTRKTPLARKSATPKRTHPERVAQGRIKRPRVSTTAAEKRYWNWLPNVCSVCGTTENIVVHHILAGVEGKARRRDNLFVTKLCSLHHNMGPVSVHSLGSEAAMLRATGIDLVSVAVANLALWRAQA